MANGDVYDGNWEKGHREGFGEFFWGDGDHYKGEWKNDFREGKGVFET